VPVYPTANDVATTSNGPAPGDGRAGRLADIAPMAKPRAKAAPDAVTVASETRPLAALRPYPNNPRTHSDAQIEQVCRSMLEFGAWTAPCVIDEHDTVLAGHGRRLAALRLVERGHSEFAQDVPVRVVRGWTEPQKRAYVIADNSIADNAGWDTNLLRLEIGELRAIEFGTEVLGFSDEQWAELFPTGNPAAERAAASAGALLEKFMVAPFSVLNAREGWWQARKKAWIGLGLQSELGRGVNALDVSASMAGITDPDEVAAWNEQRRLRNAGAPGCGQAPLDRATWIEQQRRRSGANTASIGGGGQAAGLVAWNEERRRQLNHAAPGGSAEPLHRAKAGARVFAADPLDAGDKRLSGQSGGRRAANTPSIGKGQAAGLVALRAQQKADRIASKPIDASPGGTPRSAADYAVSGARGDGAGRSVRGRTPNAEPAGGGGGGWKETNERMAESRARPCDRHPGMGEPENRRGRY
jgi:hypothetical protein